MIHVSKSLISVSANSIDRFLNFALKTGNIKFYHIGICDEGVGLEGVEKAKFLVWWWVCDLSVTSHINCIVAR